MNGQLDFQSPSYSASGYAQYYETNKPIYESISWIEAFSPACYDGESPLLEELGVNFFLIANKTKIVLNPFKSFERQLVEDDDLAGPILFYLLFGLFLLLVSSPPLKLSPEKYTLVTFMGWLPSVA